LKLLLLFLTESKVGRPHCAADNLPSLSLYLFARIKQLSCLILEMATPIESTAAIRASDIETKVDTTTHVRPKDNGDGIDASSQGGSGSPELVGGDADVERAVNRKKGKEWFAYIKTKQFWVVLVMGYCFLPLCFVAWVRMD